MNRIGVRQHPQGGHTVAVPVPGCATARIYFGNYATTAAAEAVVTRIMQQLELLSVAGEKIGGGAAR